MIIGSDEIEKYLMRKYPNKGYCILRSIRVVGLGYLPCYVGFGQMSFLRESGVRCFYHVSLYIHCHVYIYIYIYIYIYCNYIPIKTLSE